MISAADLVQLQELGISVDNERVQHLIRSGYHYDFDNRKWYHPDKFYSDDSNKTSEELEQEVRVGRTLPPPSIVGSMNTVVLDRERYQPAFHDNASIREHPRSDEPLVSRSAELQKKFSSRYANEWDRQAQKLEMIRRYNMGENLEGWVVRRKAGGGNSIDDYEVWSPDEVLQMRVQRQRLMERETARQLRQQQQQTREFGESARMAEFTKMLKALPREVLMQVMREAGMVQQQGGSSSDV
ncbi:hypothetical protein H6G17_26140 [Chroococcidiopsis sp. FACHB-1243]|uniref:hypothetical protein n=1 Tax=Chroococcidiopsis sp. [FACHB-1243] TaxID=2692781 RepID=UPI001780C5DE|nr:hypothetical protein [Chroococcidiopsis sp. [FACHB-1243]]MBD2308952.1 hypothetical protein [Chroococcidiopsis sp. [FACHB-1243]]